MTNLAKIQLKSKKINSIDFEVKNNFINQNATSI